MANSKSAQKRIRQNKNEHLRNASMKSRVKTFTKKADESLDGEDAAARGAAVLQAICEIDRAVAKGIVHPNSGARKKSSLHRRLNAQA